MDTPPHRLGLERAVEVYSGHDDLVGVTGSGYAIGADLVLTSGDLVDPEAPCQVRAAWSERWVPAEEVWRGRGGTGAVLLRVAEAPAHAIAGGSPWRGVPGIDQVRWARIDGRARHGLRCVAGGFPRAGQRAGERAAQTLSGLADPPTSAVSKALALSVLTPEPEHLPISLWEGMSGAALLAEPAGQIVGVIATGRNGYAQRRFDVIPATALLSDERFRELAGVPPGRLETVAEGDASVILPHLLCPARDDLPPDCPDWRLLAPRHAVVPFLGREEELARLRKWAGEPTALSIAVLSGRGGTGRTRLAVTLCEELVRAGWDAGFLPLDAVCGPLSGDDAAAKASTGGVVTLDALRPTLVVVDHPEPSSPLVGELARRLAKHEHNPPVRILLLVREPGEAEWWRRLDTAAGGWLRRLNTTTVQLNASPLTLAERTEHALAAMKAFAPSRAALPAPPPLDDPEFGLPLHVHLAALMRLRDGARGDRAAERSEAVRTAGGLVGRFLEREYEQWARVRPDDQVDDLTARHAVAVVTLTAPTLTELPGLLTAVPGLRAGPAGAVARWLGQIFPGGERLTPLEPDVLAGRLLAGTDGLAELVLALHDHEGRTARHLVRMLDALRMSAGSRRVRSALRELVATRIGRMVAEAATASGTRLGDALNAALGLFADDREIAGAVARLPVRRGVRLGLRALDVTVGELAVRHLRAQSRPLPLARALSVVSGLLAAVGRVGEAVVAAAEAVDIFAAAPPYEAAGARAEALYNLGACLLLAGEPGSALKPVQEAAARFRILAEEEHPARYAGWAAQAHYNLACALLGVGRTGEAVEAFAAAGGDPEVVANVAGVLSVAPRQATPPHEPTSPPTPFEEPAGPLTAAPLAPFEGLESGGPPTTALPELAACLAIAATTTVRSVAPTDRDLAHRLHLLAAWLHDHGRTADALVPAAEAVARLRGLAAEEPELRSLLATATGLLSRVHGALDDLDAATRSAAETARNLRALVVLDPGEYRPALAGQLLDLGELLLLDDRPEEALDPLREAMGLAAERHPQARARRLLGLSLDELGRSADAVAQLELAAELYDLLSADDSACRRHLAEVRARLGRTRTAPPPAGTRHWMLALATARPDEAVGRAEQLVAERRDAVEGAGEPGLEEIHAYLSAQAMLARAWADTGRAADGFALAMQAAELLQRHAAPDRPHAIAVGQVAAALGRTLVGLGRHKEAVPHLRTALESHGQAGASPASGKELAELVILEAVALSRSACAAEAEAAADRLVRLYAALVSEGIESPVALAGALRLQGGIRFARQDVAGAFKSATRALDVLTQEPSKGDRLVTAACLELSGLCLAELHDEDAARAKLAEGTALMAEHGHPPADLADAHLAALLRLARLRARKEGPAAGIAMYARILELRPLPEADVLRTLIDDLSAYVTDLPEDADPGTLLPPLTAFTEALEREVPLSADADLHDRHARCLSRLSAAAAQANDTESAVRAARLAVHVHRDLAVFSSAHRGRLGLALAALARLDSADLAVAEQAVALLGDAEHGRELASTLARYAAELLDRGRPMEALAHCERAADLCDELDDPAVAAAVYAQLGDSLAMLDRPHAALEAVTWSLAELTRAGERGQELPHVRAQAIQVRGRVLRASGRKQEALAHLVEALQIYQRLPRPEAGAEVAAMIADDLLAAGRAEEAAEYARTATTGHEAGTVKHALALQRLARCHMMLGELTEAHALVEQLIPLARRSPDDLTYRAILADSLAQSSELLPLLRLDGGTEAEARAREAIAIYDDLMTTGMNAEALYTSRAGASLTLAAALRMRDLAADAVRPLREAVAALERYAPGNPPLSGLLARAMLMLGDALMEAGRPLEAGLVFHRGTQVTRDVLSRAVAHARLGFCQLELGRDDAADAALRVAAGLLRELLVDERDEGLADLLRDVLRSRLTLLEKAGKNGEARQVEDDLRALRT
ncbi:tetratricopeptide repeat protein [Nonomuraea polychroma]|uniref:Tetratricopeptide repeat protein n=1 Tax=Nonomuraea polychroma TaxID=46176 RepID=A0A438MP43_9ACTN|nr:tetratricopeptide repeat protein [Nonomuraea polychroma]RVX47583.1 tetratricopeptide repeat protein [Nonomuraea polychroma]